MTLAALTLLFNLNTGAYNLPPNLIHSICYIESTYNIDAVHHDDGIGHSRGVCQLKIIAARQVGYKGTEKDLMKPEINIKYASKFLRYQIIRYKGNLPKAITAYNKGHSTGSGYSSYYYKVKKQWDKYESSKVIIAEN